MKNKEEVLQNCTVIGNIVKLPDVQLDRKLYQEVAKSLQLIGGKWKGGKTFGFVFSNDPSNLLYEISKGVKRNIKKEYQFFETPEDLADKLVFLANINEFDTILEPSAGRGSIIKAINKITNIVPDCYELMEENRIILKNRIKDDNLRCNVLGNDFLKHKDKKYSKIIANPPFTKNQDIDHLLKMYEFLLDEGKLVCITSESWEFGKHNKQVNFRKWLKKINAEIIKIEKGTFKKSGTMAGGNVIIINK